MSSGSQDNSITGAGIHIPNWMKQKIGDRYDLDDSAFSPPSQDDSFFCIRYPKTLTRRPSESNYHRINKYLEGQSSTAALATVPDRDTSTGSTAGESSTTAGVSSSSIGHKSSQLMTAPMFSLEFDPDEPPPNLSRRRGSKSLPASPLSSPNTSPRFSRKNVSTLQNRYFTAAFANVKESTSETDQGYSGWLLGGLLKSREHIPGDLLAPISEGSLAIPREDHQSMKKSASAVVLRKMGEEDSPPKLKDHPEHNKKVIKPKPSELREMNFWSPTSM